jgi:hypothetical protein
MIGCEYVYGAATAPFSVVTANSLGNEQRGVIESVYDKHTPRVNPFVPLRRD